MVRTWSWRGEEPEKKVDVVAGFCEERGGTCGFFTPVSSTGNSSINNISLVILCIPNVAVGKVPPPYRLRVLYRYDIANGLVLE